ncbi:glycoside hydrolase family 3 protein [Aaosphaeria arxii CBS 175.79]|uniref:beta-glucosidase n=1 Tax=Aaosphaeria arxii CBS 175.79 TaxID=1450172 RepID=A0A6A5XN58_9PLEO|nr:glycoside hydrolase family 3 protein [Aaosphaeria arxii CBS 175.79]KAF2014319.1 glycoside hydrolase family 3 protein [Aaosphaeria arxii CBS 175.79]
MPTHASEHSSRTAKPTVDWAHGQQRADEFIKKLHISEKTYLVTGAASFPGMGCIGVIAPIPRLNFTGICLQDGPTGLNRNDLISVFPSGITVGATWDRQLMYERGSALGQEFRGKGANVFLGYHPHSPGPLGRHPLGGRNWEGFSPDPYLSGVAMAKTIEGVQEQGVQANAKHYIGNEQETQRSATVIDGVTVNAYSSNIDDRTMHELYLWPFANAIRAGVASVMCSYNRVNGTHSCENSHTVDGLLKKELGFQGFVVSDWSATRSLAKAVLAGQDMNMPGPADLDGFRTGKTLWGINLEAAVRNGTVPESRLDDMVRRILSPYFALGQDKGYPTVDPTSALAMAAQYNRQVPLANVGAVEARDVRGTHAELIREMGAAGTVLLKNSNGTLPLQKPKNIGVFGNAAGDLMSGFTSVSYAGTLNGYEFGTLDVGGGSGSARHSSIISPLHAIIIRTSQWKGRVQYLLDNERLAQDDFTSIWPVPEVCLVFLKTWASEGIDRTSFENNWNSTAVVESVSARCPSTIVITNSAGVNTLPWAESDNVTAILAAHLPGEQIGNSIVDVLFGDREPTGRLPYTIPRKDSDYDIPILNLTGPEATDSKAWQAKYTEGTLIDYRHFDARNITPLFEFGFGLGYTAFKLTSELSIHKTGNTTISAFPDPERTIQPDGNPDLFEELFSVSTQVENVGDRTGSTTVQLYASIPESDTPKVLRGFEKATVSAGQSINISFSLQRRDLSVWDVAHQAWRVPEGEFTLAVGLSSRDLPVQKKFEVL